MVALLQRYHEAGLDHAFASQIFGPDALTLLAVAGSQVPGIGLGTGVVPVYPRHPMMLAQQALTVQTATDNRLLLGIGLSHQVVVEGMWGMSFERPAAYMREYLASLMPLLRGETVHCEGERVTTNAFAPLDIADVERTAGPRGRAGRHHAEAGRPRGRRHHHLDDRHRHHRRPHRAHHHRGGRGGRPAGAPRRGVAAHRRHHRPRRRRRSGSTRPSAIYPNLPSYKAMLDKEGAEAAGDIAFIGDEEAVAASIAKLADAGATDFVAAIVGDADGARRVASRCSARSPAPDRGAPSAASRLSATAWCT